MRKSRITKILLLILIILSFLQLRAQTVYAAKDDRPDYVLYVNRAKNCVNVYRIDEETGKERPYRAFACSTGKKGNATPLGTFKTSDYYKWRQMIDASWAQYAVRFNGHILFHSVPYLSQNAEDLEWKEYNKLGKSASLGCVRLCVADAKWIYDNCKRGTKVVVYEDEEKAGPFGKPASVKIEEAPDGKNVDPTDEQVKQK